MLGIEAGPEEDGLEDGVSDDIWNVDLNCDVNDLVREVCSELRKQTMIFTSGSMVVCLSRRSEDDEEKQILNSPRQRGC